MLLTDERVEFMGLRVDNLTMTETIEKISQIITERRICQHVVINAEKTVAAHYDHQIRSIINECGLINVDGQAIVWAARMLGIPLKERVTGIDLMQKLIETAAYKGWKVYCLGATADVNQQLIENYRKLYPGLRINGHDGYFTAQEEPEIVEAISTHEADILFLGISSPKKEIFINKYLNNLNVPFCMGVGGSFDVVAGVTKRAPAWMQRVGLEWLYRIYQEPVRMGKRKAKANPIFIYLVIKELLRKYFSLKARNIR